MTSDQEVGPSTFFSSVAPTPGGNAAFHNFCDDYSHIRDLNLRRRLTLAEVDKVPFGWYHLRAVAVAGSGFFADSYDLFAINLALPLIGIAFWQEQGGVMPSSTETALKIATSVGAILEQLLFGWMADRLGRKRIYGIELVILLVATLSQTISSPSPGVTVTGLLIFGRAMMGLGIGGDYPMSAVIISEYVLSDSLAGGLMAAVFSMQGMGQLAAALVALVTTASFREAFSLATSPSTCNGACLTAANQAWRIIIGMGGLPAIFALYYRITIPETLRFIFDVAKDIEQADADLRAYLGGHAGGDADACRRKSSNMYPASTVGQPVASWSDFAAYFRQWRYGSVLFTTAASWFLIDFAFYGLGLNFSTVLLVIGYNTGPDMYSVLFNAAVGNLIFICAGELPGYWLSILTVDHVGRKPIQITGFLVLTAIFCIIGFGYGSLSRQAVLALYIVAQFFFNFGPNTTTFIIPGECFPTRYRGSGYGISAASGKLGATVAQLMVQPLLTRGAPAGCQGSACNTWVDHLMEIFAFFMLCGAALSLLLPETKGKTLEVLAGEKPLRRDEHLGARRGFLETVGLTFHRKRRKDRVGIMGSSDRAGGSSDRAGGSSSADLGGRRRDTWEESDCSAYLPGHCRVLLSGRIGHPDDVQWNDAGMLLTVLK